MALEFKFNFKDLIALDNDLKASERAIPIIAQKVLRAQLTPLRNELRGVIPRDTGRLARHFNFTIRRTKGQVTARFGFLLNKRVSASTAISANVLQKGSAMPRKGRYLWIPVRDNRNADGSPRITPRQLIDAGGFIATSASGNKIAFRRFGKTVVPAFILRTFLRLTRPPLPIDAKIEKAAPEIADDITETIAQVIEAKKKVEALGG